MWHRPDILNRVADLLLLAALVLTGAAGVHALAYSSIFELRQVELRGAIVQVKREQVAEILQRGHGGNLVTLDLAATRAAFEQLPWVRTVVLRRQWPGRIEVQVEEHVALARWGESALVNTHGELFKGLSDAKLPVFSGPAEAAKEIAIQYGYFRSALAPVGRTPIEVSVSSRRAWRIRLDGGTEVELGRENVEARLARFVSVYERTIARLNRRVEHVDLRHPNGFAVRIPELRDGEQQQRRKGRGKV
jgi:cell division protein FtsQ